MDVSGWLEASQCGLGNVFCALSLTALYTRKRVVSMCTRLQGHEGPGLTTQLGKFPRLHSLTHRTLLLAGVGRSAFY